MLSDTHALFDDLARHVRGAPDRKGEVWIPCPACGKSGRHFSFSVRGAFCLKCGAKYSLRQLAERLGLPDNRPYAAPVAAPRPAPAPRAWQRHADGLMRSYAQTPGAVQAWQSYKPLSADAIRQNWLGLGCLPGRPCQHRRLIVPLFKARRCVGFRARRFECDCEPKWDTPAGSELTLYHADAVRPGQPVWIIENPADALLLGERLGAIAVATLGVSIWKDGYTDRVRRAAPVIVAFDHDAPGNATAPDVIRAWQAAHPGARAPQRGVKLVNRLRAEGLDAVLYDWPGYPPGADWGDILR